MSAAGGGGGAGAAVRTGHLRKLKTMKKKYFVLRADTPDCSARLEYYESEKKYKSGAVPRRVIPLKSCYNITRRLDLKQKHVIALFTKEEQFCVVAENEQDLHEWLAAILKLHRDDDASEELRHPIQHVWQVNVQKKGLGASKNIQGLYNLCLTDKTLSLVKIKSHNNVISDLGIPEKVEYSLKNIRRCGDSECFFYMEVGRQTATGAGELWMHTDDSNIAQSMHSTIYLAMRNCAKETENERDHIVIPKRSDSEGSTVAHRRSTYSADTRGRPGNDASTLRNRCDSMPSRPSSSFEAERPPQRLSEHDDIKAHASSPDILSLYQECDGAETSRSLQKCTKTNAMSSLLTKNICTDCEMIRNAGEDKRNGRFAHLLELELQHVEPCIRTHLYAKLLKNIEAVKGLHLKDLDVKEIDFDAPD